MRHGNFWRNALTRAGLSKLVRFLMVNASSRALFCSTLSLSDLLANSYSGSERVEYIAVFLKSTSDYRMMRVAVSRQAAFKEWLVQRFEVNEPGN